MYKFGRVFATMLFCGVLFNPVFVNAQGATPVAPGASGQATGTVVCDSSLILDLYIAERYFGFTNAMSATASGGSTGANASASTGSGSASASGVTTNPKEGTGAGVSATPDLTIFYKGQYAALFNEPMTDAANMALNQGQMQNLVTTMSMDDDTLSAHLTSAIPADSDASGKTPLASVTIATEDPACTTLRGQLVHFFTALAVQNTPAGTGAEATAEATAQPTASS
jgi:hypothetical protein